MQALCYYQAVSYNLHWIFERYSLCGAVLLFYPLFSFQFYAVNIVGINFRTAVSHFSDFAYKPSVF